MRLWSAICGFNLEWMENHLWPKQSRMEPFEDELHASKTKHQLNIVWHFDVEFTIRMKSYFLAKAFWNLLGKLYAISSRNRVAHLRFPSSERKLLQTGNFPLGFPLFPCSWSTFTGGTDIHFVYSTQNWNFDYIFNYIISSSRCKFK